MAKTTKNVKINLGTIKENYMVNFSVYHQSEMALRKLSEDFKEEKSKVLAKIEECKNNRKAALEKGEKLEDVLVKFDLLPLDNELRALENQYKEDCKPHKETQKTILKVLNENMYYAYLLASKKGDLNAKGSLTVKKGKKTETIKVEKSLKAYIKDFLVEIGANNAENDSAIDKFAQYISVNVSGMQVANKGEDYATEKKETNFNKLFMAVFFQYAIVEKKVIEVNDDGTLKMRDFSAQA
jgi:hypothetical protein